MARRPKAAADGRDVSRPRSDKSNKHWHSMISKAPHNSSSTKKRRRISDGSESDHKSRKRGSFESSSPSKKRKQNSSGNNRRPSVVTPFEKSTKNRNGNKTSGLAFERRGSKKNASSPQKQKQRGSSKSFQLQLPSLKGSKSASLVPWMSPNYQVSSSPPRAFNNNQVEEDQQQRKGEQRQTRLPTDCICRTHLDQLDRELEAFANYVRLSEKELNARRQVVTLLDSLAKAAFASPPEARSNTHLRFEETRNGEMRSSAALADEVGVKVFGSFATKEVCSFTSDVDLALWGVVPSEPTAFVVTKKTKSTPFKTNASQQDDENKKRTPVSKERVQKWRDALAGVDVDGSEKNVVASKEGGTVKGKEDTPASSPIKVAAESVPPLFVIDRVGFDEKIETSEAGNQPEGDKSEDQKAFQSPSTPAADAQPDGSFGKENIIDLTEAGHQAQGAKPEDQKAGLLSSTPAAAAQPDGSYGKDNLVDLTVSDGLIAQRGDSSKGGEDSATGYQSDDEAEDESPGDSKLHVTLTSGRSSAPKPSVVEIIKIVDSDEEEPKQTESLADRASQSAGEDAESSSDQDKADKLLALSEASRGRATEYQSRTEANGTGSGSDSDYDNRDNGNGDQIHEGENEGSGDNEDDEFEVSFVAPPTTSTITAGPSGRARVHVLDALSVVRRKLRRSPITRNIQFIKHARVPIIKLETNLGFETDIAVGGHNGTDTSHFASAQVEQYRSFPTVVLMLKVLLAQQDLDKPFTGGIGSYKLYVLVSHHLQQHLALGGTDRPGEVLLSFLFRFGHVQGHNVGDQTRTKLSQDFPVEYQQGGKGQIVFADLSNVFMLDHCIHLFQRSWERLWNRMRLGNHSKRNGGPTRQESLLIDLIDAKRLHAERQDCKRKAIGPAGNNSSDLSNKRQRLFCLGSAAQRSDKTAISSPRANSISSAGVTSKPKTHQRKDSLYPKKRRRI